MGETLTNRASSRSHAVFTLTVSSEREEGGEGDEIDDRGGVVGGDDASGIRTIVGRAELTLVDLAGYERMYKNDACG